VSVLYKIIPHLISYSLVYCPLDEMALRQTPHQKGFLFASKKYTTVFLKTLYQLE